MKVSKKMCFLWKFNKFLVILRLLTVLFIIFRVSKFLKVEISKNSKEVEEQTMTFFFFFSHLNKKKHKTLLFAPSHFFFLMKISQSSGSLPPQYYTINCSCKPSLIAHMTCCKSSQNTLFLSLYYLLQNQAKATRIVIQVSAVELAKTHLFKSFFMLQI
jgi:hypothetical protein